MKEYKENLIADDESGVYGLWDAAGSLRNELDNATNDDECQDIIYQALTRIRNKMPIIGGFIYYKNHEILVDNIIPQHDVIIGTEMVDGVEIAWKLSIAKYLYQYI